MNDSLDSASAPTLPPGLPVVSDRDDLYLSSLRGVYGPKLPPLEERKRVGVLTRFSVKELVQSRFVTSHGLHGISCTLCYCTVCNSAYYMPSPEQQPVSCASHPQEHDEVHVFFRKNGLELRITD